MPDAARMTDPCKHKVTLVITGSLDTTTGGRAQARLGDITTGPCPICKIPPLPGRIVQGSMTVLVNSIPASRVNDLVLCGGGGPVPIPPPPKLTPILVSAYSVKDEDNYVAAVFTDDSSLTREPPPKDAAVDVPEKKPLSKFLAGLSLNLNLGMRVALKLMLVGLNAVESGCSSVVIGG